jgi:membrane protein implicated in regulation of membrane protease activity
MFLASRARRGSDRYLRWKMAALVVGAVLVLAGARLGRPLLVWIGIAALVAGFVLRFLPQRLSEDGEADQSDA